jgi:hypothetical protein
LDFKSSSLSALYDPQVQTRHHCPRWPVLKVPMFLIRQEVSNLVHVCLLAECKLRTHDITNPIHAATASIMKSLRRACRPGTNNCAISIEPEKMMRRIASKSCLLLKPNPNANPVAAKIIKCSRMWGVPVSGLRLGGTRDRITIVAARHQAAIRAILELCDASLNGEFASMLSNVTRSRTLIWRM